MVRIFLRPFWIAAMLALVPAFSRAADSEPAECKSINEKSKCEARDACIDARFKSVIDTDPAKACTKSATAGWDATIARRLEQSGDTSCEGSVCKGTYNRLKKAVTDYKSAMADACHAMDKASDCSAQASLDQKAALDCLEEIKKTNRELNNKARKALQSAVDESDKYKTLIKNVNESYAQDMGKIDTAARLLAYKGATAADINTRKGNASIISGTELKESSGVFGSLGDDVSVDARNGGARTIAEYQTSTKALVQEQNTAAATIDSFEKAARIEISKRDNVGGAVAPKAPNSPDRNTMSTAGSSITGTGSNTNNAGSGSGGNSGGNSPSKDSDSGSLLSQAGNLTKLAGASTGLAGAMTSAGAMTGSSSRAASTLDSLSGGNISSSSPSTQASNSPSGSSQGSTTPLVSNFGGSRAFVGSNPGSTDTTGKAPSRDVQIDRGSALLGSSGSGGAQGTPGYDAGSQTVTSAANGSSGKGTYYSGSSSSGSGSGGDVGIKDQGRDPASAKSCIGTDCAAMGDLKTEQFNAVGALGMPKIGAADPALATKGALDNLFGPLPSLDSLIPKDPALAGATPALEGVLLKMDTPTTGTLESAPLQAAVAVAPANSRSLFDRVHSVHEVALKRGTVALFHKKL